MSRATAFTSKPLNELPSDGYLRCKQFLGTIVPIGRTTLWRWVNSGEFPPPVKIAGRIAAWRADDIRQWIDGRRDWGGETAKAA